MYKLAKNRKLLIIKYLNRLKSIISPFLWENVNLPKRFDKNYIYSIFSLINKKIGKIQIYFTVLKMIEDNHNPKHSKTQQSFLNIYDF